MRTALAAIVLALALAPAAAAKSAPLVPLQQQTQMKAILASFGYQDLAYIPTKAPVHYIYSANVVNSTQNLITLADGGNFVYFTVQFLNNKLSACSKGSQVALTVAGDKMYSKSGDVWFCLKAPGGKIVKVVGHGPGLSREDIGVMLASAKHA
ncbi:MAG TPA: hypothetical protein VG652_01225 [Gaiellaceae bacterium]|nr:hypothetical protein [Gaiellaceae bacterium]